MLGAVPTLGVGAPCCVACAILASGLKRHAVTLFEGGRVIGEALVAEVTAELWASYAAGAGFEGDMARLTQVGNHTGREQGGEPDVP